MSYKEPVLASFACGPGSPALRRCPLVHCQIRQCLRRQLLLPGASPSQNNPGGILTTCRACRRQPRARGASEACRPVGRPRHHPPLTGRLRGETCVRWGGPCCLARVRTGGWGVGLAGPCRHLCVVSSVREFRPRGRWSSAHGIVVRQPEFRPSRRWSHPLLYTVITRIKKPQRTVTL